MGCAIRQRGPIPSPSVKVEAGIPEDDEPMTSAGPATPSICSYTVRFTSARSNTLS